MMKDSAKTFQRNGKSVREVLETKYDELDFEGEWLEAFGRPEKRGVWLIWGASGNGKTSFALKLCKYLCNFGRVAYDSLEEGACLNMQNAMRREGMIDVNGRFILLDNEKMDELSIRLNSQRSPDFVVIDSLQYSMLNYRQYVAFKEAHPKKVLIFISHAEGKLPKGRTANAVKFDAFLKIYVEGFRAYSQGRTKGPTGYYDIWPEQSATYAGEK